MRDAVCDDVGLDRVDMLEIVSDKCKIEIFNFNFCRLAVSIYDFVCA